MKKGGLRKLIVLKFSGCFPQSAYTFRNNICPVEKFFQEGDHYSQSTETPEQSGLQIRYP